MGFAGHFEWDFLVTFGGIKQAVATGGPTINWLANNLNRARHILQPHHFWEKIVELPLPNIPANAIANYQAIIPTLQQVVANSRPAVTMLQGGAAKWTYSGVVQGYNVVVRIWVSPQGQMLIEDAWVII